MTRFEEFTALHRPGEPFLLPNAWDFGSGALFAERGFPAVGTTSLGVAAAAGKPDAEGATEDETRDLARALSRLPLPVTVDVEGGFGRSPEGVADYVSGLADLGVAGVNLEDGAIGPEALREIVAAVKARVPGVFVNARADTYWLGRPDLEETVRRCAEYADAGADGLFVPGVADEAAIAELVKRLDRPLNVLYGNGIGLARLAELGVARVSTGSYLYRVAVGAAVAAAAAIRAGEPAGDGEIPSYQDVTALLPRGSQG
ncbi:isocitrate lyase/PEP mutase family protein [Bailinhaonella thermotolerans]|uniref:Isocitrate lyase/phosphoenolpyruvate mutase family protein n=1 Tax=Bailinhaonella thermotolerans TaxID=1070861 RepID=A0A3A4AQQ2_9ACTN|nr:isocitrate lyase/phosphoenolpyruvate mutase family protein [Bailinhaonella thermotolerans]RJL30929.1 isocitrate lyase/phosphoenolpyruvate mutase family protein [Bailinhaonella thermotolerans]